MPAICFDLEGPLSPQDNAYEVLGLAENGHKIFEVISRYDDILTLEGRENYEPGDTLKLIAPFLIYHGISEEDITRVSERAKIVAGAKETISELRDAGWKVHIISTSYEQHAYNIGEQLGVGKEDIACTSLPLNDYREQLKGEDFSLLKAIEERILGFQIDVDEEEMVKALNRFFFDELLNTPMGKIFQEISVVGGERKVRAMSEFVVADGLRFGDVVGVGDSITDFKMLHKVRCEGGLALVFNGNKYAIPYADIGVAAMDMRSILPVVRMFSEGKGRVFNLMEKLKKGTEEGYGDPAPVYHFITEENMEDIIQVHKRYRKLVRGEAGKLG